MGLSLGKKNTFEKKNQVSTGFCQVARVTGQPNGQHGFCASRSFILSRSVKLSNRPSSLSKFNNYGQDFLFLANYICGTWSLRLCSF